MISSVPMRRRRPAVQFGCTAQAALVLGTEAQIKTIGDVGHVRSPLYGSLPYLHSSHQIMSCAGSLQLSIRRSSVIAIVTKGCGRQPTRIGDAIQHLARLQRPAFGIGDA
ncbi:hypothetical protein OS187_10620 [Xanthomonadaceae bacterium JHOS43]|nr:hypothetical protein [Xanthomonadaceae bacterium JHOS43]